MTVAADHLHVADDGPRDASALVMIHGLGGSTRWWDRILPMLAVSHRVLRVDLPGHGRSAPSPDGDFTIPASARRIGEALDRIGARRVVAAGHSTGGAVATALAEHRGDLVTALALIDTGPYMDAFVSGGLVGKLVELPRVGSLLWRLRTDGIVHHGLSSAFVPGFAIPQDLVDDPRGMTFRALNGTSRESENYLRQRSIPDRLTRLGKPLLVIFGERDQRWRSESAEAYRAVAGSVVEVLPGVGHSPMVEDPARTAVLLLAFVVGL